MSWLPFMFTVDKQISISASKFNHCSSLCPMGSGVVVAWYSGSGECQDDQSAYLTYLSGDNPSEILRIGDKTGNPILWREENKCWLLWSRFEDDGPMLSLAHRWKYCSLWVQEITYSTTINLIGEPRLLAESNKHLLARINPLVMPEYTILPLYDEINRECVVYRGRNGKFEELSRYGDKHNIIQPAIWLENERLHSLSRNFGNSKYRSLYYYSDDFGENWKYGGFSHFLNLNNSIAVHKYLDHHVVIWNNKRDLYRRNMSIGIIKWQDAVPCPQVLKLLNPTHGSYPNICVDSNDQLHFTYTDHDRAISHHVWNKKAFAKYLKRSRNTARRF